MCRGHVGMLSPQPRLLYKRDKKSLYIIGSTECIYDNTSIARHSVYLCAEELGARFSGYLEMGYYCLMYYEYLRCKQIAIKWLFLPNCNQLTYLVEPSLRREDRDLVIVVRIPRHDSGVLRRPPCSNCPFTLVSRLRTSCPALLGFKILCGLVFQLEWPTYVCRK